jgi:hypothetical protein
VSTRLPRPKTTLEGVAVGALENPAVNGPDTVRVRFVFDDVAKTITYSATVNGLSQDQVLFAHFHRGAVGTNGPIIINLSLVPFTQISGTVQLSDADVADLRAGLLYFNAHSKDNPGGFARFQLVLPAAPAPVAAAPAVTAPSAGDAGLLGLSSDHSDAWQPFAALIVLGMAGTGTLVLAGAVRASE